MKKMDSDAAGETPVVATIERYAGSPDICTIHPDQPDQDSSDETATTAWLSAEEGSYCSLSSKR